MKNKILIMIISCFILIPVLTGCSSSESGLLQELAGNYLSPGKLSSPEDIKLSGDGCEYYFTYDNEDFYARYREDHWIIYNSYKIRNSSDIVQICQALSDEHPIHGSDYESWRTPKDMAYEWEQHNIAYELLPEGNSWRDSAENVDLDPEDQGKSFKEIYEDRTGKRLDFDDILEKKGKIKEKVKEKLKEILEEE